MQNRFTVKDCFYVVIGLLICVLIWLNLNATSRENETLDGLKQTLASQGTTLSTLNDAIKGQQRAVGDLATAVREIDSGGGIDPAALTALTDAVIAATSANSNTSGSDAGIAQPDTNTIAAAPTYQASYNAANRIPINTSSQNNQGLSQQWQNAPDRDLPTDFASGDELIQVWPNDAQKLTPLVSSDAYSRRIHWYTHEYLINFNLDAPFEYTPGLAKAWEVSEDGMVLTFHMFEQATFSDGTPVTADDVIFTWDTVNNPEMDTAHYRSYTDQVARYEKLDDHTVRFHMTEPYFDALSICGGLLVVTPKHIYGDFDPATFKDDISDLCVGSGPYILANHVKNNRIELVRNENYWGPKPPLDRYTIRIIESDLPKLQEFKSGAVDLIAPTSAQFIENRDEEWFSDREAKSMLYYSPRGGYNYIGYNLRRPYFADNRTRQALTMLINRQDLIDTVVEGLGMPISGPFFYRADQSDKTITPWPHDPVRARELLKEVGWEDTDGDGIIDKDLDGDGERDPFEVTYLVPSGGALGARLQRFVQEGFRDGGIKLNLDQLEWSVFLERLNEREYDMVTLSWTGNTEGDPTQIWHSDSEPDRGSNHVGFINPEADALIEAGRAEMNREKRMAIWHQFHQLLHEQQPYTFLYGRPNQAFLDGRFENAVQRDYRLFPAEWFVPTMDQLR